MRHYMSTTVNDLGVCGTVDLTKKEENGNGSATVMDAPTQSFMEEEDGAQHEASGPWPCKLLAHGCGGKGFTSGVLSYGVVGLCCMGGAPWAATWAADSGAWTAGMGMATVSAASRRPRAGSYFPGAKRGRCLCRYQARSSHVRWPIGKSRCGWSSHKRKPLAMCRVEGGPSHVCRPSRLCGT